MIQGNFICGRNVYQIKYNKSERPQNGDEFFKELERIIEQE